MNIDELITYLQDVKKLHGNITVCIGEYHEYWGSVYTKLDDSNIVIDENAQPNGPKSGNSEIALVIECH